MNRTHASAAVLGTSAVIAAAFLVPRGRFDANTATRGADAGVDSAQVAHARTAMTALLTSTVQSIAPSTRLPPIGIALCHDCRPSQALVRVLLRHQARGSTLPPAILLTDRSWPALDTLARHTQSTVQLLPRLSERVGVTPVALDATNTRFAVGLTHVTAMITALSTHPLKSDHGARP